MKTTLCPTPPEIWRIAEDRFLSAFPQVCLLIFISVAIQDAIYLFIYNYYNYYLNLGIWWPLVEILYVSVVSVHTKGCYGYLLFTEVIWSVVELAKRTWLTKYTGAHSNVIRFESSKMWPVYTPQLNRDQFLVGSDLWQHRERAFSRHLRPVITNLCSSD